MTTAVNRPRTVTARITTADNTPDLTPGLYTVTVYMNTHNDS